MRVHFLRLPKHHNLKLCVENQPYQCILWGFHYFQFRSKICGRELSLHLIPGFFFFAFLIINHLCLSLRVYFEMKSVLFDSLGCMCTQCHKRTVISLLVCLNIYIHAYNQLYGIYLLSTYILTSIHACIVHTTITYIKT